MPTPVPLKILSRRRQRNRLIGALLFAFFVGVAVHAVRPAPTTQVRYEVLVALAVLAGVFLWLLAGLRRINDARASMVLVIEGSAIWLAFAAGVLVISRESVHEVAVITVMCWLGTVLGGLVVLGILQHFWPPRRSLACPACDYDLRESTGSVCSECGNGFVANCAACGCVLRAFAGGTCPDCAVTIATDTVLVRAAPPAPPTSPAPR